MGRFVDEQALKRNSRKARFASRSHHHLALVSLTRVLAQTTTDHAFASFALPVFVQLCSSWRFSLISATCPFSAAHFPWALLRS